MIPARPRCPGSARRRQLDRRRDERGAVLVEMCIILPLLMAISLATLDLGLAWRASLTVSGAARAGARTGSNLGISTQADKEILKSVAAALGSIPTSEIEMVVVYKSATSDGAPPSACTSATALSNGGDASALCNTYSGTELSQIAAGAGPTFGTGCTTSRDRRWCPTARSNSQASAAGPDYLGVYVKVNHATSTKMFGTTIVVDDSAVMPIEPGAGN